MNRKMIAALLTALLPASQAVAHGHGKKEIKAINDSAAVLSSSNPDLSSRLKEIATRESGLKESAENRMLGVEAQDAQTLREAAPAVQAERPELAKELRAIARKEDRMKGVKSRTQEQNQQPMQPEEPRPSRGAY